MPGSAAAANNAFSNCANKPARYFSSATVSGSSARPVPARSGSKKARSHSTATPMPSWMPTRSATPTAVAERLVGNQSSELTSVPTPNRVRSKSATPGGYAQLMAGSALLKRAAGGSALQRALGSGALKRWVVRTLVAAVGIYLLWRLVLLSVTLVTTQMWFDSVQAGGVYRTTIEARILLFVVF